MRRPQNSRLILGYFDIVWSFDVHCKKKYVKWTRRNTTISSNSNFRLSHDRTFVKQSTFPLPRWRNFFVHLHTLHFDQPQNSGKYRAVCKLVEIIVISFPMAFRQTVEWKYESTEWILRMRTLEVFQAELDTMLQMNRFDFFPRCLKYVSTQFFTQLYLVAIYLRRMSFFIQSTYLWCHRYKASCLVKAAGIRCLRGQGKFGVTWK